MKFLSLFFLLCITTLWAEPLPLFFKGNQHIKERELYSVLELYKPYFYEFYKEEPAVEPKTVMILLQTIQNYYKSRGYFHAHVHYTQTKESIFIEIEENAPIIVAEIESVSKLDIHSVIPFKEGDVFDPTQFSQSKKDIKLLYANNSFCNAELDAKAWVDIEKNLAYISYKVTPKKECYFGAIEVTSSENIDADIIKSLLYIQDGKLFSSNDIVKSYESLYAYEGISKATIDTDVDNNSSVKVNVSVAENEKPMRFQVGVGANSDEGPMLSLGIKHRNFYRNLKTLSLDTRVTEIKQTIKLNFDMPIIGKKSTGFELGFENEKFIGFKERRAFGTFFLKENNQPHSFKESLVFDSSHAYESENLLLFPENALFILSPKLEWNYDVRDKILDPSRGYFLNAEVMGSLLSNISDASYYKFKLSGGYILPVADSIIAMQASLSSLHLYQGDVPESYKFYAGGMYSNRAYGYRKLSPVSDSGVTIGSDSLTQTTIEYRFPIYGDFKGVVFNDNTFIGEKSVPDYEKGYYSGGVGIRYMTPIGPIAIDVGFDLADPSSQYALHFHIGEMF